MTTPTQAREALDSDLDAITTAAASHLPDGEVVHGDDGDPVGVTYRDAGTRCYYAADIIDCCALLRLLAAGERDAYSLWCADLSCLDHPAQARDSREEAEGDL